MQNYSQQIIGAEHLNEVIAFLKNADMYVRQGNVLQALDEIVHAREKNPTIMYARAYEEYIRSVLIKQKQHLRDGVENPEVYSSIIHEMLPTLEKILELAIKEIKQSAISANKQKEVMALRQRREEEQKKEEEQRITGITRKISSYLSRAKELQAKEDFHNALNEIARAFMLDPTDERIQQLEDEVKELQAQAKQQEDVENIRRQQEFQERRQRLFAEWQVQRQREKEEQKKQEEEINRQARTQKIREYIQVVRSLFAEGKYDEALGQLSFVLVLDPLNEDVLSLNWKIREEQTNRNKESLALKQRQLEVEQKKHEAINEGIQKQIQKAEKYLSEKKYQDALHVITQAYFIDPTNEEVGALERRILTEEEEDIKLQEEMRKKSDDERRRKQEAELHRLAIEQQKREQLKEKIDVESKLLKEKEEVLLFLSKARGFLSQSKNDEALAQVAAAFKINPFDEEISKLQKEILSIQQKEKLANKIQLPSLGGPERNRDEERDRLVRQHLQEARRLRSQLLYREALDEIAQAYQHDPVNEDLFALEGEIQQEFLKFDEQQQREKETSEKSSAIKKSLATARECISREAFGEALAWIDYALSFDMNRYETLQLKDEVEKAQRKLDERKNDEDKELVIQFHLSRAMEFMSEKKISEAVLEVDLALRLNPNNKETVALRTHLKELQSVSQHQKA